MFLQDNLFLEEREEGVMNINLEKKIFVRNRILGDTGWCEC